MPNYLFFGATCVGVILLVAYLYNADKSAFRPLDTFASADYAQTDTVRSTLGANQITKNLDSAAAFTPAATNAATSMPDSADTSGSSKDLLPSDTNAAWSNLNPTSNTGNQMMPDMLIAGAQIGIMGPTMKNANLQMRSDPQIMKDVSCIPWNVSTWDESNNNPQVCFELGGLDGKC